MRIVEKLLYGIGGLLALILLFVLFCHFKPELGKQLGESLTTNAEEKKAAEEALIQPEKKSSPKDMLGDFDAALSSDGMTVLPMSGKEYQAPAEEKLRVPSWAEAKSGYLPVRAAGVPITEQEAADAFDKLGVGSLGKDISLDAVMYPYYYMLDAQGKMIYRQIYANADALTKEFAPVEAISPNLLQNAFTAVVNDHPELFWVDTAYEYRYAPTGQVAAISLSFYPTAKDKEGAKQLFEASASNILKDAKELDTPYEKELYVHNKLISKVSYSKTAPMNQSAYSALVGGKSVCAGYARAFQYLMQQLQIPCYYCTGFAGENHAWNIIKLDDGYYNVDTTWADTQPNNYVYFNGSDRDYAKDHIRRNLSVKLPPCSDGQYRLLELAREEEAKRKQEEKEAAQKQEEHRQETQKKEQEKEAETVVVLRTLEQAGFEREDIIKNIDDYYVDCSKQLVAKNKNTITFKNVVAGEKLWNDIRKSYEKGSYKNAYMNRVLAEKHIGGAKLTVSGEALADGSYLLTHTITFQ